MSTLCLLASAAIGWPPVTLVLLYSVVIVGTSLFGGWIPNHIQMTHVRLQCLLSFVGGLMLGIAILHLLPHAAAETRSLDGTMTACLIGLLTMFLLIRIFHFHQHGPVAQPDHDGHDHCSGHPHDEHDGPSEHGGPIGPHQGQHAHAPASAHVHRLSWLGVALGLSLHTLIDGFAVGAAVASESQHNSGMILPGLGVFLAIALHKPLDALSITTLMSAAGWGKRACQVTNLSFAMMCPLGALLVVINVTQGATTQHEILGWLLAFSAGVFLCISLGDLLPEVQFHRHDRFKLTAALLMGVATAYWIGALEPAHVHGSPGGPPVVELPVVELPVVDLPVGELPMVDLPVGEGSTVAP